ncbi:MAG: NAD(P)H-hydrate dehydratase [Candidatus Dasytiphilus stammeri]
MIKSNSDLPNKVWSTKNIKEMEYEAAKSIGITIFDMIERAGQAAFNLIIKLWPNAHNWLILCGHGNNGADAYIIACLAKTQNINVTLLAIESDKNINRQAKDAWLKLGGKILSIDTVFPTNIDLMVDGLLGTGLNRAPRYPYDILIKKCNEYNAPIFSIDIPSGLLSDTGDTPGQVINATHTLTFMTLKTGLLIGKARNHVGQLHYNSLGIDRWLKKKCTSIFRIDHSYLLQNPLPLRLPSSHKGNYGKLLLIGGDVGKGGAIRLAAEAALRSGAGLVKVLTHKDNICPILSARPELMVQKLTMTTLELDLEWANTIVIGPGLGFKPLAIDALKKVQKYKHKMVWDADALNILANNWNFCDHRIITPHTKEAARLLHTNEAKINSDRLLSAQLIVQKYGGVVILKGAGTIIATQDEYFIVDVGNAGMATGGMGDVLSGIIGGILGQNISLNQSAMVASLVHGAAGDFLAMNFGMRGFLATDLFSVIHKFINPNILNNQYK